MRLKDAIEKFTAHSQASNERGTGTIKGYHRDLILFCLYMRNPLIHKITDEHIVTYFNEMKELGYKENSFLTKSIALKKLFTYWKRKGYPVLDPLLIPIQKRVFTVPRVATEADLKKILDLLPKNSKKADVARDRLIINMLADSGMRVGELVALNLRQIEKQHALIRTEKNKSSRPMRKVFWSEETEEDLAHWLKERKKFTNDLKKRFGKKLKNPEALFIGLKHPWVGYKIRQSTVELMFRKMSRLADLERTLNPHSLRHKFGHDLNAAGANNSTISSLMGHATMTSSFIYTMMDDKESEKAWVKYKKK